jgi:hypothetical protein
MKKTSKWLAGLEQNRYRKSDFSPEEWEEIKGKYKKEGKPLRKAVKKHVKKTKTLKQYRREQARKAGRKLDQLFGM